MEGANEAELVTRVVIEGTVFLVKLAGSAAGRMLTFLAAAAEGTEKTRGRMNLSALLKSGKELKCFTFKEDQVKVFADEAKRYGIVYSMVKRGPSDKEAGTYDVLCKAEDAARLNRILERMGVTEVQVTAQGSEATAEQKDSKEISDVRDLVAKMMQPDEKSLNPEMAAEDHQAQSAASYQQTSDIQPENRTSINDEIANIKSNINEYQAKDESSPLTELLKNMLSSPDKEDDSEKGFIPEAKQKDDKPAEKSEAAKLESSNAGAGMNESSPLTELLKNMLSSPDKEDDSEKDFIPEAKQKAVNGNDKTAEKSDAAKPESSNAGTGMNTTPERSTQAEPFSQDDKERLMEELEKSYSNLMNGLNSNEKGRE